MISLIISGVYLKFNFLKSTVDTDTNSTSKTITTSNDQSL